MWQLYALAVFVAAFVVGYLHARWQGKKIAEQAKQIEQVQAEAKAIAEELDNAEQRKKIEQANRRLTAHGVDEQLQSKGWYRED
ncbi:DUF2681 domain-containing protein [Gallibacterium genomosp. 1]|uniref:DUF2681 domain-containing protein n=1 Tax=Gallibacterium genomosp. 1 TaxID=155515 RepID=UPI00057FAC97|nr:DUF2681 domain-containing protein [Gallibacterium genomosp. 1]